MSRHARALVCDSCDGRGWVQRGEVGKTWPEVCSLCKGERRVTFYRLAKELSVDLGTLVRLSQLRARPDTAEWIFERLVDFARRASQPTSVRA